jgi:hypothetical protein
MYFCENRSIIMVIILPWNRLWLNHPFCSAARNSPACKGKSLRCLRKCRLSYIDTSPPLSARRHLTAALWGPSRLHLGCQTHPHQTWCAPRHLGVVGRLFSAPNSKLFAGNYGCNRRSVIWAHGTPRAAPGTECEAVRCGRAGCVAVEGEGRLRREFEVKRQKTSTSSVSVREPPSPAQAGLFFGALLTPRGDFFAFKGATCLSTGSSTVTAIKSQSLSSLGLRPFTPVCVLPLPTQMKASLPKAMSLIASGKESEEVIG